MIGDYLFSIIDRYDHVEKKPCKITGIQTDGDSPLVQTDDSDVWYPVETYEPIPLTPEILEKNGFKNEGYFSAFNIGDYRIISDAGHVAIIHGGHADIDIPIMNVNELQHFLRHCGIEKEIVL